VLIVKAAKNKTKSELIFMLFSNLHQTAFAADFV
jgi:hypothetical protein